MKQRIAELEAAAAKDAADHAVALKAASRAVELADEKNYKSHKELQVKLFERGAIEGLLDFSSTSNVERLAFGCIIHDKPESVLSSFLQPVQEGAFQRHNIHFYDNNHWIVYWRHYQQRGTKLVDFLVDMVLIKSPDSTHIHLASVKWKDLPKKALKALEKIAGSPALRKFQRCKMSVELRVSGFEFGQASVTLIGSVEAEEQESLK
ncbi:hypothetical protein TrRE_jg3359, partial [Triparma retinervis]